MMDIMPSRKQNLEEALRGLKISGEPLITFKDGQFRTVANSDDLGGYYFIPNIANLFGLNIDTAIFVFYASLIFVSIIISLFWIYNSAKSTKIVIYPIFLVLLISSYAYIVGDVYIASFFSVFSLIPLFLIVLKCKRRWITILSLIIIGLLIGFSNFIRIHAATPIMLFILLYILLHRQTSLRNKLIMSFALVAGIFLFGLWKKNIISKRDHFLTSKDIIVEQVNKHSAWHSLYIGLGFLKNNYGLQYKDEVAIKKVATINNKVKKGSKQYYHILKQEYLKFIKQNPTFFIETIMAKTGFVIILFLIFSNVGLYFIFNKLKDFSSIIPYAISLIFSSLPGILVMPRPSYLLGFLSLSVFMSIYFFLDYTSIHNRTRQN